jgi:DNA-binding transcriptional LysR family regulator
MSSHNLSHLAAFVSVARHSGFQKAGAELGLSTSAVSHAIRALEERLGVSLFNRTTRSVALTNAGQRLMERLQSALSEVGDALDEMNNFRGSPTGTLRINTSRAAGHLLVAPLMQRFLAAYPEIHLEIVDEDGLVDIVAGGFDVGIRFHESVPEDMVAVPIGGLQRIVVVGAPGYFAGRPAPHHPHELATHDCIRHRFPSGRLYKWEFSRDGVQFEVEVNGRVTAGDAHLSILASLDGIGLCYTLEDYVAPLVREGRLVCVLDDWCPPIAGFMLYYPQQRRMPPALRAFIDMATEGRAAVKPQ